jgi:hypothetical protein
MLTLCSAAEAYRGFEVIYCLHFQGRAVSSKDQALTSARYMYLAGYFLGLPFYSEKGDSTIPPKS